MYNNFDIWQHSRSVLLISCFYWFLLIVLCFPMWVYVFSPFVSFCFVFSIRHSFFRELYLWKFFKDGIEVDFPRGGIVFSSVLSSLLMIEHFNSPLKVWLYIYISVFSNMLSSFPKATICKLFNTTF